jgi:DNA-binding MarR family transcriptional regulator
VRTISSDTAAPERLAGHLRLTVARLARRLRQEAGSGLGPTLTAALATVEHHGPLTPSALADRERIRRPSATRIVAKLEDEGLVRRAPDPDDRRSCRVTITPAGRARLEEARSRKAAFLAERVAALSPEDRELLERAAGLLDRLLEDAAPAPASAPSPAEEPATT